MATSMNRIREYRMRAGISQQELGAKLPDHPSKMIVSLIENGHVLPSVESMQVLCDLFCCSPTDLYDSNNLDLFLVDSTVVPTRMMANKKRGGRGAGHDGMTEFRCWISPEEKDALENAVTKLGYRNTTEWFREAFRNALERCTVMGLSKNDCSIVDLHSRNQIG